MRAMMSEPIWSPSAERITQANISRFMALLREQVDPGIVDYPSLHAFSVRRPEQFWAAVWDFCEIRSSRSWDEVVDKPEKMPGAKWFAGARLNFAENLLRFRDQRPAIIFCGEDGQRRTLSYQQLAAEVAEVASALRHSGVVPGDRVAAFMPNMPETVIAMLASASLGAVWSSCSPDFGINGVLDRFGQIEPKVLFAADSYCYGGKRFDCTDKIAGLIEQIGSLSKVVIVPFNADPLQIGMLPKALAWRDFIDDDARAEDLQFEQLPFDHPLYIMYSSGTTGVPKCIVHGAGGTLIQQLKELVLHTDLRREDRIFYFTTCGWMMWNWLVSSLAVGATIVLYDGNPFHPGPEVLFDLVDELDISVFGVGAKYLSAVEKSGLIPRQSHRLEQLRTILSTGSPLAPASFDFVYQQVKESVCLSSISGGTDIVSCFALGCPILPVYRGELQCLGLGMKVEILDHNQQSVRGQTGELVCSLAFPSMPIGFWNDANGTKYHSAYFAGKPGVWSHGDEAMITVHDGLIIVGRSDATLNPGGVRIGTAELYRQVETLDQVLESIAVGQHWQDDERIILFVRLRPAIVLDDELRALICTTIRTNATARHVPAKIIAVADIPRTISGKIVELAVRQVIHGQAVKNRDALANPEALDLYRDLIELDS